MNKVISLIKYLVIVLFIISGCKKDDPGVFDVRIILVDEFGKQTSIFEDGDSLIFEFYFSNHTGKDATYLRPCSEYGNFLKIYKEDPEGVYQYFGQPIYYCAGIKYLSINDDETILLTAIPWSIELGWPEMKSGKYYVGDTFTLHINSERYDFTERIYFDIL